MKTEYFVSPGLDDKLLKIAVNSIGNNRTVELVEAMEGLSGIKAVKTHGPEIPGDAEQTWADVSKAKELLGYSLNYDLKQGLRNFAKWYKKEKVDHEKVNA